MDFGGGMTSLPMKREQLPLLWLSTAFICGVLSGRFFERAIPIWLTSILVSLVPLLLILHWLSKPRSNPTRFLYYLTEIWPKNREVLLPGFILPCLPLVILGGMMRYQSTLPVIDQSQLSWYHH